MSRPRFYLDPIHNHIRYSSVDLAGPMPAGGEERFSWVMQRLIDAPEFQRLRHIRQNALANLAFQGAEHSRFCHSMGAAHLAGVMVDRIVRNMEERLDPERKLATCVAALLHDLGHGPFSHTLELVLEHAGIDFHHEDMTLRFLREDTAVGRILREVDPKFPEVVAGYIDKDLGAEEHWTHKLVSSQLDADRLDYLLRDADAAGLPGHSFDLDRILDMLGHLDGKRIAVHRRGIAPVEVYLVTLHHLYRIIYLHHTVRAADFILSGCVRRALELARAGDERIFPRGVCASHHPLWALLEDGKHCPLEQYARLGEYHVWASIEDWRHHEDAVLADLAGRLMDRRLFAARDVGPRSFSEIEAERGRLEEAVLARMPHVDEDTVAYYVTVDEPRRTSYKTYDWRTGKPDESIWVMQDDGPPVSLDEFAESEIVAGLKKTQYFPRLIYPKEIEGPA